MDNKIYTKDDLDTILKMIISKEVYPEYEELKPIAQKLYLLFDPFSHWLVNDTLNKTSDYWKLDYVDSCIYILTKGKYKDLIDEDLLKILTHNIYFEDRYENPLIELLELVFNSKRYLPGAIAWFLKHFFEIIYTLIWNEDTDLKFKYEKFNDLYRVIQILKDRDQLVNIIDINILSILLSYCYINDIRTYEPVFFYIYKKDYCLDIIRNNGFDLRNVEYNELDPYEFISFYKLIPYMTEKRGKVISR